MKKKVMNIFLLFLLIFLSGKNSPDYKNDRENMVKDQIELRGVKDKKVLDSMLTVPRHFFVSNDYIKYAYEDRPLPIGYGQTISQPYIVALMTELLELKPDYKVLEIGTGSGYQAAVLSRIVKEVYTVEIYKPLYELSKRRFEKLGYNNIKNKKADGYYGWEEKGEFNAVIVTCAPSFVPPPLIKQLKVGGLMVIPVGPPFTVQKLLLIKKTGKDKVQTREICSVSFVPLIRETK